MTHDRWPGPPPGHRLVPPPPDGRPRTAALAGIAAPRSFGVDPRLIRLFAPDLGRLLTLTALAACALAALRLAAGALALPRTGRGDR